MTENGYQPTKGNLDKSKPPQQGSGVPSQIPYWVKSIESKEPLEGKLPKTPKRPPRSKTQSKITVNTEGVEGVEVIRRTVKKIGSGAHATLPKEWMDETVVVIRTGE